MGLHSLVIIYQPNLSGRTLVPTITTFLSISNFKYVHTSIMKNLVLAFFQILLYLVLINVIEMFVL